VPKQRYSPPNDEVAAEIAAAVELFRQKEEIDGKYREAIAKLADRERGRGVPIAYLAAQLGVERKTVYRHLGRSMT
jgi:transcriptional regulator of acetoin/glycerol metabolism